MSQQPTLRPVLGPLALTTLGIGSVIGTGIFVLTGTAASLHAGPALVISMIIAAVACALAGLCYAELAAMIPIAGSAYTYAHASSGQFVAWIIGWDLVLEYALSASTVAVGWSGYFVSFLRDLGLHLPPALTAAPGSTAVGRRGSGGARRLQPAGLGDRAAGRGAAPDRDQPVGRRQHGAGGRQGRGAAGLRRRWARPTCGGTT